mmetsp:Transcript_177814/g.570248  ORF Transcript_177814/g.570248 Transcript_177814/m.570248 type:complete len:227 (-) Transcript_177814:488-1168(-)
MRQVSTESQAWEAARRCCAKTTGTSAAQKRDCCSARSDSRDAAWQAESAPCSPSDRFSGCMSMPPRHMAKPKPAVQRERSSAAQPAPNCRMETWSCKILPSRQQWSVKSHARKRSRAFVVNKRANSQTGVRMGDCLLRPLVPDGPPAETNSPALGALQCKVSFKNLWARTRCTPAIAAETAYAKRGPRFRSNVAERRGAATMPSAEAVVLNSATVLASPSPWYRSA